ncbi:hypothetical protein AVEN_27846-2-1, partial [Araneus ventricosus]
LFNILELSGVPSDKPRLNVGVPVLLIRNLDIPRLRNGTRLQITHLGPNVMKATVMTDIGRRESVLIPRLQIIPKDLSSQFKRLHARTIPSLMSCLPLHKKKISLDEKNGNHKMLMRAIMKIVASFSMSRSIRTSPNAGQKSKPADRQGVPAPDTFPKSSTLYD